MKTNKSLWFILPSLKGVDYKNFKQNELKETTNYCYQCSDVRHITLPPCGPCFKIQTKYCNSTATIDRYKCMYLHINLSPLSPIPNLSLSLSIHYSCRTPLGFHNTNLSLPLSAEHIFRSLQLNLCCVSTYCSNLTLFMLISESICLLCLFQSPLLNF